MQVPTMSNVRVRSIRDANLIFFAVAKRTVPMTVRRLDADERAQIRSGNVYVWEERGTNSEATGMGIERWTDGYRWGPSRVRDDFLFYYQRENNHDDGSSDPAKQWARIVKPRGSNRTEPSPPLSSEKLPSTRRASDPEKLIKQTYSVIVTLPEDRARGIEKKWHLTTYFTQASIDGLGSVENYPGVGRMKVPEGLFKCARAGKMKRDPARQRQIAFEGFAPALLPPPQPSSSSLPDMHDSNAVAGPSALPSPPQRVPSQYAPFPAYDNVSTQAQNGTPYTSPISLSSPSYGSYSSSPPYGTSPPDGGASTSYLVPVAAPPPQLAEQRYTFSYPYTPGTPAPLPPAPPPQALWRPHSPPQPIPSPVPAAAPANTQHVGVGTDRALVPLDFLQCAMGPRRDPTDDLLLRQFDALTTAPGGVRYFVPIVAPVYATPPPAGEGKSNEEDEDRMVTS